MFDLAKRFKTYVKRVYNYKYTARTLERTPAWSAPTARRARRTTSTRRTWRSSSSSRIDDVDSDRQGSAEPPLASRRAGHPTGPPAPGRSEALPSFCLSASEPLASLRHARGGTRTPMPLRAAGISSRPASDQFRHPGAAGS